MTGETALMAMCKLFNIIGIIERICLINKIEYQKYRPQQFLEESDIRIDKIIDASQYQINSENLNNFKNFFEFE